MPAFFFWIRVFWTVMFDTTDASTAIMNWEFYTTRIFTTTEYIRFGIQTVPGRAKASGLP
jgi:hypothetical protein